MEKESLKTPETIEKKVSEEVESLCGSNSGNCDWNVNTEDNEDLLF